MTENKVIVIGGDHYNTLWVIRSLGLGGISPYAIIVNPDKNVSFVTKSKYLQKSWVINNETSIKGILQGHFNSEKLSPVIICTSDGSASYIDEHYDELKDKFLMPSIGGKGKLISYWMDKSKMIQAAKEAGFNIPRTWNLNLEQCDEIRKIIPEDISYPCIIKPLKSSEGTKYDFRICTNEVTLVKYLDELKKQINLIIIQEYIKSDYEVSFPAVNLYYAGKNIIPGLLIKLSTCNNTYNLGMSTYACLRKDLKPLISMEKVHHLFKTIPYFGLYSMEFLVCEDKAYFLEINLRNDGNMFYVTTAGVNLPLLWVLDITNHDISHLQQNVSHSIYGMTEISYIKYFKLKNWRQGLKDWYRSDCFSIFYKKDIMPFIYKFIYFLK